MSLILPNPSGGIPGAGGGTEGGGSATAKQRNEILRTSLKLAYFTCEGRMFDRWTDIVNGSARSNGKNEDDLIDNPVYIIESIYRDEIFVERDLISDTATLVSGTTYTVKVDGTTNDTPLNNSADDFYNNAILNNVTRGTKGYVSDYIGSTKTLTVIMASGSFGAGDKFYLTNVNGDNRIDFASFDVLGNTTNGTRDGWVFRLSINKIVTVANLINQLCFEANIIKVESYDKIKLVALDLGTSIATWGSPLKQNGVELAKIKLSPLQNVFTDFRLRYAYDYGKNEYTKEYFVNKNGFTTDSTLTTEQTLCKNAETNYKVKRTLEYKSDYIFDDATARKLIKKLVLWFTKQRLMIAWIGSVKNFIQYEIGDKIKINYSDLIPSGINNSVQFMVYGKTIDTKKKIVLLLIELSS